MRTVRKLYELLGSNKPFEEKYPLVLQQDGKVHILYVAPCLNGTGFYRMIIPMLELNKTATHSAILTGIHKWNFNKQFEDYDNPIDRRLIEWADYVVLPTTFSDTEYIKKSMRAINDELQFVMDVDCLHHQYPKSHPNYEKVATKHKQLLLKNIAEMDIVTAASEGLIHYYEKQLAEKYPDSKVYLEYQPNLISDFGFQEIESIQQNQSDKLRIGIIGNVAGHYDTISIKEVLFQIKEKYKEKVELVFFGWNGLLLDGSPAFEGLEFTTEKSVRFLDYYNRLNELQLDLVLLPFSDNPFNSKGKSFIKYLETAAFALPVVASNVTPFKAVIDDEETGMLAETTEEWMVKIEQLAEDAAYRQAMGKAALKSAWRNYSFTTRNLQLLTDIFI